MYHWAVHFYQWRLALHWRKISIDAQLDSKKKILSLILMILLLMPLIFYNTWYDYKWILPKFGTGRPYFCFCETCWKRHKSFRFFFPWEWSQDTRQTVSHDDKAGIGWGWVSSSFYQHKQQSKLVYFSNDMMCDNFERKYNYKIQIHFLKVKWVFSCECFREK